MLIVVVVNFCEFEFVIWCYLVVVLLGLFVVCDVDGVVVCVFGVCIFLSMVVIDCGG